jgi:hypothetical protein
MDIAIGIAIIALLSVATFGLGIRCGKIKRKYVADVIAAAAAGTLIAYGIWGRDSVLLAWVLPFSNLLVLSNLFAPLIALIAGIMWEKKATPVWRRVIYVAGALAAGIYSLAAPFVGPVPQCADQWRNDVCLQTTSATCSAACAATVLNAHGIETSEAEMARLCFTRKGTLWQGLYRALKLKTAGTDYDVQVFNVPADELDRLTPGPMILTVGIPHGAQVDPIYVERYSWTPGTLHSVVFYDFAPNDRVDMGDPSVETGREQWTTEDLRVLYRGTGLRLVKR